MKFIIKNLGPIKEYDLELGNLTLICGKNNTGKTFLSYSIYGFFEKLFATYHSYNYKNFNPTELKIQVKSNNSYQVNLKELEKEIIEVYSNFSNNYKNILHEIFSTNSDEFRNVIFNTQFDEFNSLKNQKIKLSIGDNVTVEKKDNSDFALIHIEKSNEYIDDIDKILYLGNSEFDKRMYTAKEVVSILFFGKIKTYFFSIFFPKLYTNVFLLSAERSFLLTFQKEIDQFRSKLMQELQKSNSFDLNFIKSRLAYPIEREIDYIRNYEKNIKENSFLKTEHPEIIENIEQILGIKYEYLNGQLMINLGDKLIPHYLSSSSVKSLSDMHLWLKHNIRKGSFLMIDEPELNLHPENQIKLARLFARLINAGINIWITTHSDYIVKELNNLLLLSNDFAERQKLLKDFGYDKDEILNINQVKVYISNEKGTLENIKIDKYGMSSTTFDETIEKINEVSNSIYNMIE